MLRAHVAGGGGVDVADGLALVRGRRRVLKHVPVKDAGEIKQTLLQRPLRQRRRQRRRRDRAVERPALWIHPPAVNLHGPRRTIIFMRMHASCKLPLKSNGGILYCLEAAESTELEILSFARQDRGWSTHWGAFRTAGAGVGLWQKHVCA